MNHLYNNNDDKFRSKLTEHEFNIIPSAWDDMANRLDQHDFHPKTSGWWWSFPIIGISLLVGSLSISSYWQKEASVQAAEPFLIPPKTKESAIAQIKHPMATIPVAKTIIATKTNQELVNPFEEKTTQPVVQKKKTIKKTVKAKKEAKAVEIKEPIIVNESAEKEELIDANVKRTKTIIKHQYSITPLKKLTKEASVVRTKKTPIVGSFGIGDQAANQVSRWKFSMHAGLNTKVYGQTQELSLSPYGGVAVGYRAGAHHGIQLGLQYKNMGRIKQNNPTTAVNSSLAKIPVVSYGIQRIDMLEMPLVYQCYPHPRINIFAGIKGAWLFNVETANPEINALTNKQKGIETFDVGVLAGAEFNITKHIAVGLQYSLGLINLTAPAEQQVTSEFDSQFSSPSRTPEADQGVLYQAGEVLVPADAKNQDSSNGGGYHPMLKLPKKLHNTDLQVHLKYTF